MQAQPTLSHKIWCSQQHSITRHKIPSLYVLYSKYRKNLCFVHAFVTDKTTIIFTDIIFLAFILSVHT